MQVLPDVSNWDYNGTVELHGKQAHLWVYEKRWDGISACHMYLLVVLQLALSGAADRVYECVCAPLDALCARGTASSAHVILQSDGLNRSPCRIVWEAFRLSYVLHAMLQSCTHVCTSGGVAATARR